MAAEKPSREGAVELCPASFRGGHRFEARYDVTPPKLSDEELGNAIFFERDLETISTRTYVHDICVKCGVVVKRSATAPSAAETPGANKEESRA